MADEDVLSNSLLASKGTDNFLLAFNLVNWLRGPEGRSECLFFEYGRRVDKFDEVKFVTLPDLPAPPIPPVPPLKMIEEQLTDFGNRMADEVQTNDRIHSNLVRDEEGYARWLRFLAMAAAAVAAVYLLRRAFASRQPTVGPPITAVDDGPPGKLLAVLRQEMVRGNNFTPAVVAYIDETFRIAGLPAGSHADMPPVAITGKKVKKVELMVDIQTLWRVWHAPTDKPIHYAVWREMEPAVEHVRRLAVKGRWHFAPDFVPPGGAVNHAPLATPIGSADHPPADVRPAQDLAREASHIYRDTAAEVSKVVVGAEKTTQQLLIALIAGGHCLLEGVPGVAKTTLSKCFAKLLGCDFQRVQFTPDLLPSDVTGTSVFDRNKNDFVLRKGPVFCQILLADEINRVPAKTQSALLEAMQEYQVTVDGSTIPLPRPFLVLATQNPVEQEGVYRLPEAQLDRFLLRIEMGYPGYDHEVNLLKLHSRPPVDPRPMFTPETILKLQELLPSIYGRESLYHYIIQLAEATRKHPDLLLGASPRAALSLLRCARARAALEGRHFFTHEDVQSVCLGVLGHRLILRPEAEIEGRTVADVVRDVLARVKVLETV